MIDIVLWVVYGIGVLFSMFLLGMTMGAGPIKLWEEAVPFFLLALIWPFCVVLVVVVGLATIAIAIPGLLCKFIIEWGGQVGKRLEEKSKSTNKEPPRMMCCED